MRQKHATLTPGQVSLRVRGLYTGGNGDPERPSRDFGSAAVSGPCVYSERYRFHVRIPSDESQEASGMTFEADEIGV